MNFEVFNKTEIEEMFQMMFDRMPHKIRQIAIAEFGSIEKWKSHYIEMVSSEDMQKRYTKVVEWYGGKEAFLNSKPLSKEVAESYKKREEIILYKLVDKRDCDINSFEVKEIVGEYAFVMKQLCQIKQEQRLMMGLAQYYRNQKIIPMIDKKYGTGAAEYFAQVIEVFYKNS